MTDRLRLNTLKDAKNIALEVGLEVGKKLAEFALLATAFCTNEWVPDSLHPAGGSWVKVDCLDPKRECSRFYPNNHQYGARAPLVVDQLRPDLAKKHPTTKSSIGKSA